MSRSSGALLEEPPDEFVLPGGSPYDDETTSFGLAFKRDRQLKGVVYRADISIEPWSENIRKETIEAERRSQVHQLLDRSNLQDTKMNLTNLVLRTLPLMIFFVVSIIVVTSRDNVGPAVTGLLVLLQIVLFVVSVRAWLPRSHR